VIFYLIKCIHACQGISHSPILIKKPMPIENIRDENRALRDGITMLIEKTSDHERRLQSARI